MGQVRLEVGGCPEERARAVENEKALLGPGVEPFPGDGISEGSAACKPGDQSFAAARHFVWAAVKETGDLHLEEALKSENQQVHEIACHSDRRDGGHVDGELSLLLA